MKTVLLIPLLWLSLPGLALCAETSDYKSEARSESEVFTSKVLKVYACDEAGAEFVAYVVNWRGHEVVVTNGPITERYRVGDTIRCQMHQSDFRLGDERKMRMTFAVFPQWLSGVVPPPDDARLRAVAEEVAARRREREAIRNNLEKPKE